MNSEQKLSPSIASLEVLSDRVSRLSDREDSRERRGRTHRVINTVIVMLVAMAAAVSYVKAPEIVVEVKYQSEIAQIVNDEGLRLTVYNDSLGHKTIGFGHLVLPGENFTRITPQQALDLLRGDYATARASVEKRYPWASGDVKLVLINMTYQLGPDRLSKFSKALSNLEKGDYDAAAAEFLDSRWASQAPNRANRIAGRILQLSSSWW